MLVWGGHSCPPLLNLILDFDCSITSTKAAALGIKSESKSQAADKLALSEVEGSIRPTQQKKSHPGALIATVLDLI